MLHSRILLFCALTTLAAAAPRCAAAAFLPIEKSVRAGLAAFTQDSGGKLLTITAQYRAPFFKLFGVPVGFEGGVVLLKDTEGSAHPAFDLGLAPTLAFGPERFGMFAELNLGIITVPFAGDDTDLIGRVTQTAAFLGGAFRMKAPISLIDGMVLTYRRCVATDGWNELRLSVEVNL